MGDIKQWAKNYLIEEDSKNILEMLHNDWLSAIANPQRQEA